MTAEVAMSLQVQLPGHSVLVLVRIYCRDAAPEFSALHDARTVCASELIHQIEINCRPGRPWDLLEQVDERFAPQRVINQGRLLSWGRGMKFVEG